MGLEHSGQREELLGERITDAELKLLLTRLGEAQMGGSEESTVGAVVEATGVAPVEVGRVLAEIRKEQFDQKFTETFAGHEERIEKLEGTPPGARVDPLQEDLLRAVAQKELMRRQMRPVLLVLILVIIGMFIVSAVMSPPTPPPILPNGAHRDWSYSPTDGTPTVEHYTDGQFRVKKANGLYRLATKEEAAKASSSR